MYGSGREALTNVQELSVGPPGCPGVVGRLSGCSGMVGTPYRMFGSGR